MLTRKTLSTVTLLVPLLFAQLVTPQMVSGRFGGAGGRGGFNRGGDFGHGFDESHFGNIDKSYYEHPSETGYGTQRPLATDGGLGRVMDSGMARNIAAPVRGPVGVNGDSVRHAYADHPYADHRAFDADWWAHHHDYGWYYPWMGGGYAWGCTSWPIMAGFLGVAAATSPVPYDYGNNITYQGNNVYYGSQPQATATQYYEQADNLATLAPVISLPAAGEPMPKLKSENQKDWKPFGVFSLVQGGQTDSSKLFQIMVNKEGIIHGNYYDMMTDEVKPISGSIDKKSMRAAWKISGVKDVVYDTGVSNLLKQESPILVHYGKDKTEQWNLVRLEQPNKTKEPTDKAASMSDEANKPISKASSMLDVTADPAPAATEQPNKLPAPKDNNI
jgi:hypothetical protein